MRLALIGSRSFIASQVARTASTAGMEIILLSRNDDLDEALRRADVAINFALHPDFRTSEYTASKDLDLRAACAASKNDVHFIMLSTRRVYPAAAKWGAKEDAPSDGDETLYGQNKARSEKAVSATKWQKLTILRLSNIIGFEYEPDSIRRTFMAQALRRLHAEQEILFDMSPDTGRDFLPVEACAEGILRIVQKGVSGTFNLSSGVATPCGEIANALLKGFGSGKLTVANNEIRDAFYLDTNHWNSTFPELQTPLKLMDYCEALGRRLKNA